MERAKKFYLEKNIQITSSQTPSMPSEFLPLVHEFEVFLRDADMFKRDYEEAITLNKEEEETDEEGDQEGIGYRGTFEVNPKFDLRDEATTENERVVGYATPAGTKAYAERSSVVHSSNFKQVKMIEQDETLTLSKMIYGTQTSKMTVPSTDFLTYMAIRTSLLSGGINHIDTGYFFN